MTLLDDATSRVGDLCRQLARPLLVIAVSLPALGVASDLTVPATQPAFVDPYAFLANYRIAHYVQTATQLQELDPASRAARLREMASDPERASEVYPLCRMLFEAKVPDEFRRPMIGGARFADEGDYLDWPLEPITLVDDVPILIALDYRIAGEPESPSSYVDYCLAECKWRETGFAVLDAAARKAAVDKLIAANPALEPKSEWLQEQAE